MLHHLNVTVSLFWGALSFYSVSGMYRFIFNPSLLNWSSHIWTTAHIISSQMLSTYTIQVCKKSKRTQNVLKQNESKVFKLLTIKALWTTHVSIWVSFFCILVFNVLTILSDLNTNDQPDSLDWILFYQRLLGTQWVLTCFGISLRSTSVKHPLRKAVWHWTHQNYYTNKS